MRLNIEGYPDERLMEIVREVRPEQCTLVPDAPGAFTSEEGWKLDNRDMPLVWKAVTAAEGARLPSDPVCRSRPDIVERVPGSGADGIEIYTGTYAEAFRTGGARRICAPAPRPRGPPHCGLVVNAGHDLNLDNLPELVRRCRSLPRPRSATNLLPTRWSWASPPRSRYKAALSIEP